MTRQVGKDDGNEGGKRKGGGRMRRRRRKKEAGEGRGEGWKEEEDRR